MDILETIGNIFVEEIQLHFDDPTKGMVLEVLLSAKEFRPAGSSFGVDGGPWPVRVAAGWAV